MTSCLGIYIEKNIIKYAKVSSENGSIKITTQGVKNYTDILSTLNQIISETDSANTPISVNINSEKYDIFNMSSLLSKKDLIKAINTEFESICYERHENYKALETRYVLINDSKEKNKIRVIHLSEDKIKLNQLRAQFNGKKLTAAIPISFGIANIAPIKSKENTAIINIEDETYVTLIEGEKVYDIQKIDEGASRILDAINLKENSYSKAYEICKNTTIYTMDKQEMNDVQDEKNEYLPEIIPTLYEIANKAKEIIYNSQLKIEKVYITGTAAIINNIDLYFNEIFDNDICYILKPMFLGENPQINIKDYIEVNSAIALALQGVEYGLKDINFLKISNSSLDLSKIFKFNANKFSDDSKKHKKKEMKFNFDISDKMLSLIMYPLVGVIALFIIYTCFSSYTAYEINTKSEKINLVLSDTKEQINKIEQDIKKINAKSTEYQDLITSINDAKNSVNTKASYKYTIPTLLSLIAEHIPKGVQLTSIENTTAKKIVISAQAVNYEQLAYFKAEIKQKGILKPDTVVSSQATKSGTSDNLIKIVIEGELP